MPQTKNIKNKRLTSKAKIFADEFIQNKRNGTKAAMKAYDTKNERVAAAIACENLNKPNIKAYLEAFGDEAGETIVGLMRKTKSDNIKLDSAKYVYDQVHGKALAKADIKMTGDITVNVVSFKTLDEGQK